MMMKMIAQSTEDEGTDQNQNSAQKSFSHQLPPIDGHLANSGDSKAEREQRSLALEKTYVYDVYEQIAPHLKESRHRPWPRIKQFLMELEPGSLVCDVGCGNGKYLDTNKDIYKIGLDQCEKLAEVTKQRGHEVLTSDNMALPFRDESFDAVLSIAVIHHFATTERRVQALKELARILRIGGRLMITVWALEQRHRKFESQDVLVPWHKPIQSSSEDQTSLEKDITSTTTSDDDILNYHAYTSGMDSEPYFTPTCYPRKKHKFRDGWVRHQGRNLDSCRSSSQSSSDLSSPNETCYSFVRRALQKLSNSKTWDNPHQRCRPPWFLQSTVDSSVNEHSCSEMEAATTNIGLSASRNGVCGWRCEIGSKMDKHNNDKQDSLDSNENADDIPIELHDVDSEIYEISDLERRTSNEGLNKGSMSRASSSNLKDSSKKSQSAKQLQRLPSVDSSSSPNMGHKSKSLSDILNLFSINFLHSRKTSQDSTSGSSSSSVAKHSSSSSTDSKSRQGTLLSSLQNHNRNGIIRSKSSHFTLAKVEEDNEQSASQPSTASLASDMNKTVDKAHLQQRWSVTGCPGYGTKAFGQDGYLDGSGGFDGKTCSKVEGNSRRPRSLILEHSVHIPRTLSAEDHKNGNTILPDLDSCLSFYGISGTRFPSPPYTKAEHNIVPPENKNWTENCSSLSDEVSTAQTNDLTVVHQHDKDQKKETQNHTSNSQQSGDRHQNEQSVKSDVSPKCWPIYKSRVPWCFNIREKSHSNKQQVKDHQCTNLMENSLVKTVKPGKSVFNELPMPSDPAKNDLWRDLFFANIIKQIIDREHLFPFRSMPNLYKAESVHSSFEWRRPKPHGDTNTSVDSTISVPKKHYSIRRRLSQPSNLDMKSGFKLEPQWIKQAASINTNPRNGFQKRSFSADVCCPLLEASKSTEDGICPCSHAGGISDPSSRNRCCYARHRSCACNSLGEIKKGVIKHSLSAGDSALKSIPFNLHSVATIKVGNNKIIVKEDSLQSDTSIDSDDSVASVIRRDRIPSCEIASPAPQKDSTSGSLHGRFERLCSNCSKESSNHSDTSFDSEESCISVIAVVPPGNAQGVLSSEVDSGVTKDAINDDVTDTGDNRISDQRSQPISESCCLKAAESIEADVKAVPRLSNDDVSLSDKDDSNTDIDEHAESLSNVDEIQSVPSMKSSISWEKYLDACESLVLDSIFYVNVAYSDYSGCGEDVATDCLMPDQLFDYYDDTVSLKYFDSEMPMTAEMCWLEPTPSWKSSEDSLGEGEEGSDSNEDSLPPLNDNLSTLDDDDTLKLQIFDGPDATEEEELHKPPLAASPQGRLLEAAVDVANTLQSAVSVAVTSTEKRKVTLAALKNCEHFQCLTKESVGIVVTEQLVPTLEMDHSIQDASKNRLEVHKIYADAESYNDVPFPEILESIASDFPMDPPLEFQDSRPECLICDGSSQQSPGMTSPELNQDFSPSYSVNAVCQDDMRESPSVDNIPEVPVDDVFISSPENNKDSTPTTYCGPLLQSSDNDHSTATGEEPCLDESTNATIELGDQRVREDVINGNIPGHRELLKKLIQEWGYSWLEFPGYQTIPETRTDDDKNEKRRRKSDSEAMDMSAPTKDKGSSSTSISRGRSMDFASVAASKKFTIKDRGYYDMNKDVGFCSVASAVSIGIQYQIQEEEEVMTKSNESSELTESSIDTKSVSESKDLPTVEAVSVLENISSSTPDLSSPSPMDVLEKQRKHCAGETDLMQISMTSSIENHFGNLEFILDGEGNEIGTPGFSKSPNVMTAITDSSEEQTNIKMKFSGRNENGQEDDDDGQDRNEDIDDQHDSLSLSTSDDSILSGSENGGSAIFHRYYHVFREGELDHLIEKYVENLHIIASYYDHANWCIIAEKVQVWRI